MSERDGRPVDGDVIEGRVIPGYGWEWNDLGGPRGRRGLPWFGVFLVVFGGLLLLRQVFPSLDTAGSLLFLAAGLAFLVLWIVNRGAGSLYLGAIITALAAPDLLAAANVVEGPGVGTFCLGAAFLFIALVRATTGGGWGWQAGLGAILAIIGATSIASPTFNDLVWPIALVVMGAFLLLRAARNGR